MIRRIWLNGWMMYLGKIAYVLLAGLAIALLVAACTDLRSRRIGNRLNAAIALGAPPFWWACGLGWSVIGWQLALAGGSFALLCGLFALRAMGGGDVKLLTALALWIRPAWFAHLLAIMALLGGVLAVAMAGWHGVGRRRLLVRQTPVAIPYGVAIAGAGLWILGADYLPGL